MVIAFPDRAGASVVRLACLSVHPAAAGRQIPNDVEHEVM
jgi:hypothetical protein